MHVHLNIRKLGCKGWTVHFSSSPIQNTIYEHRQREEELQKLEKNNIRHKHTAKWHNLTEERRWVTDHRAMQFQSL
jgi:phage-related tail protein